MNEIYKESVRNIPESTKKEIEYSMAISDKICALLKEKGITNKELAKRMGKTEAEVSRWLGGMHNFTLSTLVKIACVLGEDIVTI